MLRKPGESIEEWEFSKKNSSLDIKKIKEEIDNQIKTNMKSYKRPKISEHKQKVMKITGFKSHLNFDPNQISDEFKEKLKNNFLTEKEGFQIFKELIRNEEINDINLEIDRLVYKKFKIRYPNTCYHCHKELLENSNYCTYCGEKIK